MKPLPLLAFAACLMAATAQAQSPAPTQQAVPVADPPADVAASAAMPSKSEDQPRLSEARCIRQTGSRIRQRDARTACNGQPGRSYSKDDLDRTGQPSLAEALRTLDPSIR
ncbi:hypothetical protein MUU77_13285 [Pseudoxanthomonas sp. F37]|uniref:hypothetical protein n=1 Tax=Pseudoxanthomonas sp. F37 TaxID=2932492 RepID=UPI001FD25F11|nr:hypothetical protein [Pseudoxanthomonas sp. F37]UOV07808.1 hypothetical protein MUU77_13285 [Pseudoxanthomonas sp. F37]